jgi:predicted nucleotidyltransferase
MKTTKEYLDILSQYKKEHAMQYGISRMGVFGSVARGEQREESDVDVVMEGEAQTLFTVAGIKRELEELLEIPVDIVRLHDRMNPRFRQRIINEAIYV